MVSTKFYTNTFIVWRNSLYRASFDLRAFTIKRFYKGLILYAAWAGPWCLPMVSVSVEGIFVLYLFFFKILAVLDLQWGAGFLRGHYWCSRALGKPVAPRDVGSYS